LNQNFLYPIKKQIYKFATADKGVLDDETMKSFEAD